MIMNKLSVHSPNKTLGSKQGQLLVAGILVSSLLAGCGGGGGGSTSTSTASTSTQSDQQAAVAQQAAAAAQQAAAEQAAQQAAAAQVAADQATREAAQQSADQAVVDAQAVATAIGELIKQAVASANLAAQQAAAQQEAASAAQEAEDQSVNAVKALTATNGYVRQAQTAAQGIASAPTAADAKLLAETALAAAKAALTEQEKAQAAAEAAKAAAEAAVAQAQAAAARRYTKLDGMGNELSVAATSWSCLKDKQSGLVWEMKTNDGGVRDKDWRYRHLHNYGGYGNTVDTKGQVLCRGLGTCDAYTYVNAVNGESLCGRNSWRLPLKSELGSIAKINAGGQPPHIDQSFFPDIVYKPYAAAYCAMNTNTGADAEHNYQGVDYGLPLLNGIQTQENLENSILIPLRYYGEIKDGLVNNPGNASNWICYTRLVSSR